MEKQEIIYEGKAKILYTTEDPNIVIQYFKDDATAFNAQKKGSIRNKGILNNRISSTLFEFLQSRNIPTHYLKRLGDREMLVRRVEIIPLEVVFRNVVAGSLAKRVGLPEGSALALPILELYYKNDVLGDPMVNDDHALVLGWALENELELMKALAWQANHALTLYFKERGVLLIDGKLEFGRDCAGQIILADEISPDGLRLWDAKTFDKLDKDRFRRDLGGIEQAYERVYELVCGEKFERLS